MDDKKSLLQAADHRQINSVRWHEAMNIGTSVIPLTVADMDFKAPEPIIAAVTKLAQSGDFSYVDWSEDYYKSVENWLMKRQNWKIDSDWIIPIGRMCEVVAEILRKVIGEGSNVILPFPAYSPTSNAIRAADCHVIPWPLKLIDGHYSYDFDSLEFLMGDADAIILTNPHNPTGRVWTKLEQKKIARLADKHDIFVISDEFHADFTTSHYPYIPYLSTCNAAVKNGITLCSPGKTFNIAALETANIIVPNLELREKVKKAVDDSGCHNPRFFAEVATIVAYSECSIWLDQLLELINEHFQKLEEVISRIKNVELINHEGTYLAWIDCRKMDLDDRQLEEKLIEQGLLLDSGNSFGIGGSQFLRMNVAVPDELFDKALRRLETALSL